MQVKRVAVLAVIVAFTSPAVAQYFETPKSFTVSNQVRSFAVGDFNRDGNLDLVVLHNAGGNGRAQIYLGNGKGNFSKGATPQIITYADCVTVGDFNNDGILDLAIGGLFNVNILLGNGDGTFQTLVPEYGNYISTISAGDFNNDGKVDLLLNGNQLMLGNGDGTFQAAINVGPFYPAYYPVAVGDFNGDKKLDYAMIDNSGDSNSGSVLVVLGNGDGTFQSPLVVPLTGTYPTYITAADFNLDGKLDLAVSVCSESTCMQHGAVNVLLGNGNGTFQVEMIKGQLGFYPMDVFAADFNGDGKPDLVEVGGTLYLSSFDMTVWTGKGDGTFNRSNSWALPAGAGAAAVGDFNNDGQPDLAILDFQNYDTVTAVTTVLGLPGARFQAAAESPVYAPDFLATGDFNEDGKLDVIAGSGFDNKGTVALGQGNGTFKALPSFPLISAGGGISEILVGDFNGDHHLDLISVNSYSNGEMALALGNGNGTFKPGVHVNCGSHAVFVAAGDFNGDGILDLATANDSTIPSVDICLGKGDGTFQPPVALSVGTNVPSSIAAADLNGDGKLDLVIVNYADPSSFETMLGNGDGTFQAPSPLTALGRYAMQPFLADLNGDGKLDMFLQMNNTTNNLYVLLGNGDGTFQMAQIYSFIEGPSYVTGGPVVGDFNGDGFLDLAAPYGCCTPNESGIGMLLGKGDGTFTTGTPVGVVPGMIVGGDFNGDGKTDLVFGNPYNGMLAVLVNVAKGK